MLAWMKDGIFESERDECSIEVNAFDSGVSAKTNAIFRRRSDKDQVLQP